MFANFEVSSHGLLPAQIKPRQRRSDLGCYACRRKKKRCDNQKPTCLRCSKGQDPSECTWPDEPRVSSGRKKRTSTSIPASSVRETASPASTVHTVLSPTPSSPSITCPDESESTVLVPRVYHRNKSSPVPLINTPLFEIPSSVARVSPDLTPSMLLNMTNMFERTNLYPGYDLDQSVLSLGLQLSLKNPALLHAWVSCGAMVVSHSKPKWKQRALMHYNCAVKGLSEAIQNDPNGNQEWRLAAVLLLHIFEECLPTEENLDSAVHLEGARRLFQLSLQSNALPPSSVHRLLLIEAYIYRIVVNMLFQPDTSLPFDYVEQLLIYLSTAKQNLGHASWRSSPWVGISGDLFDIAFKLSWLKQKRPLTLQHRDLLATIAHRLETCPLPGLKNVRTYSSSDVVNKNDAEEHHNSVQTLVQISTSAVSEHAVQTAQLYHLACTLLFHFLHAISICPATTSRSFSHAADDATHLMQTLSAQGRHLLSQLAQNGCFSSVQLWPLILLGTAATGVERDWYEDVLTQGAVTCGEGSVGRARKLLWRAWGRTGDGDMDSDVGYGVQVLLEERFLKEVFL